MACHLCVPRQEIFVCVCVCIFRLQAHFNADFFLGDIINENFQALHDGNIHQAVHFCDSFNDLDQITRSKQHLERWREKLVIQSNF